MGDFSPTTPIKFMSGIFISISAAQCVIPLIFRGCFKLTLYSCYGITANCNTFPVVMAILFGNEDKEGWVQFWNFALSIHPSLDLEVEDTSYHHRSSQGFE
jgi:hypothetical protein